MTDLNTLLIVVHEIYGVNRHMEEVCRAYQEAGFDVICPNLLNRETPFSYSEESIAYRNFMDNVGFDGATEKVKSIVSQYKDQYEQIFIIGFSVGATIAWRCSEDENLNGVVGYYGSRIREYLEVTPTCPVLLFFPEQEPTFNVDETIEVLIGQGRLVYQFKGKHGFSDPFSSCYEESSAHQASVKIAEFIGGGLDKNLTRNSHTFKNAWESIY